MAQINIMVMRHSAFYSPLISTISAGFLKAEGLESSYALAAPDNTVTDGIASGRVHVAQSAVATSFAPLMQGETPVFIHFAQINERDGFFIAGKKAESDFKWENLRGKKVLVDHFTQPLAMFKYACYRQGVLFDDIDVINAGDVDEIDQVFRQGKADYVHQQGPAPQQLKKDGLGHIVASVGEAIGPVAFSSLCAAPNWLESDMAQAFMRAYRKARQHVLEASAGQIAAEEISFFPGINEEVLATTIADYQRLGCWSIDPRITKAAYEVTLDVFEYNGLIQKRFPYDTVVTLPPGE